MERREDVSTTDICITLFCHLSEQGLKPEQINKLVEDVFDIVRDGGIFTVDSINSELKKMGWQFTVDDCILELVLSILEKEFRYEVNSHTVH